MRILLFALLLFCSSFVNAQTISENELTKIILTHDSLLFQIGFNKCNLEVFDHLLSDDFEFYHDKSGFSNKAKFLSDLKEGLCGNQNEYKSRRELVSKKTIVTGLYDNGNLYGAIQEGTHVFYETISGQQEKPAGSARFTHVWLLKNGEWKLARSLSFEHVPVKMEEKIHNE